MTSKLSHSEWLERKERDLEDERYEKMMTARRESLQKTSRREKSQQQFEEWLLHKESFERGVELLDKLDNERCQDPEKWFEVAVSLNAVDCLRGIYKAEGFRGLPADRDSSHNISREELKKRRTLETEFFRWSRRQESGHEFENIPVDEELAKTFTLNTQEIMSEYAEQLDRAGEYIIPNLKYSIVKVKQAAHDKRNLYNPDKVIYNKIFNRLLKSEYSRAQSEMYNRLDAQAARYPDLSLEAAEKKALSIIGLGRLAKWGEDDLITRETIAANRKQEDKEYAKKVHEGFIRKKESMKIRLPVGSDSESDDELAPKKRVLYGNKENKVRMDFSRGKKSSFNRPSKSKPASNSVEILSGTGSKQKFAYCTNKRDLELARQALAREGHVYKENFKDEDGDALHGDYQDAKQTISKKQRLRQKVREREEKANETYKEWATQKEFRGRALEALSHIDKPGKSGQGSATDEAHWRFVGEQLKSVDPTLLGAFSDWSKGFRTPGQCKATWESLPPNVCDTCCPSSAVHKVLLKFLNRPGMCFADVFDYAVDRQLRRNMASDGRSIEDATAEERQTIEDSLQLNQKAFRQMMSDAGVILQPNEVRILTTLFDEDGDGKISRKEFLRFTGYDPRPNARGEALQLLRGGNLCCWEASCHVSGLTNGYDVRPVDESDNVDDDYASDFNASDYEDANPAPKRRPLLLRSGLPKKGWSRVPLPDLHKRMRKLINSGDRNPEDFKSSPPRSCELSQWSNAERTRGIEGLENLAERNREITRTLEIQTNGEAPLAPVLYLGSVDTLSENERQRSLVLQWKPQDGSMFPSFYVLEYGGKEGSKSHRNHTFKELFRDPPSATGGAKQIGRFVLKGLQPGSKYSFRLQAFNGYGSSPFTYNSFVTAPEIPAQPVVQSATPTTLVMSWDRFSSAGYQNLLKDLRDVFRAVESRNRVDREEFLNMIENDHPELFDQLESFPSHTIPGGTVLETIESAQSDYVTWDDLKQWLSGSGANSATAKRPKSSGGKRTTTGFQYVLCKCVSDEEVNFKREGAIGGKKQPDDVICSVLNGSEWFVRRAVSEGDVVGGVENVDRFDLPPLRIVEMPQLSKVAKEKPALKVVLSKPPKLAKTKKALTTLDKRLGTIGSLAEPVYHLEVYEQVYVGSETTCTLTGLNPGEAYQFRVFVVTNPNTIEDVAVASRLSRSTVVHMPAVAPPPAKILTPATTDSVSLTWSKPDLEKLSRKSKAKESTNVKRDDWMKVVNEWAQDPSMEQGGGVSESTLRKMFMRYDKDANGEMDRAELAELFSDLGINSSAAGFDDALRVLDVNGDGNVSYSEFSSWWKRRSMQFMLLHRKITEVQDKVNSVEVTKGPWKVVYRGEGTEATVGGLAPNSKHSFALQCEMNRHMSSLSKELVIFTAPETPCQPVVVEAGSKHCRIKFYEGHGGASRFIVEAMLVEKLPGSSGTSKAGRKKSGEWSVVYEGKDTLAYIAGLEPNAVYRLRVKALNADRVSSSVSLPSQFTTTPVKAASIDKLSSKANAASYFNIECTGDVVTGDTILFSERVFGKAQNQQQQQPKMRASLSQQSIRSMSGREKGEFICERTVAGRVVKSSDESKVSRTLGLEVLWSSLSSKTAPTRYALHTGARISRTESELFKFETFRAKWLQEDARWTYDEERDSLLKK